MRWICKNVHCMHTVVGLESGIQNANPDLFSAKTLYGVVGRVMYAT